jgi:Hydrazine synthase alpha subunit middle domain
MSSRSRHSGLVALVLATAGLTLQRPSIGLAQGVVILPNPVLFVTQVPVPQDFTTIGAVFGNHQGALWSVARGGDLWIRYGDGTLKNLTQAAGYGTTGLQGASGIAVREPSVHWTGTKALFSMVRGGATRQYELGDYYWQIYEITGMGPGETPVVTPVPNQPQNYNNVSPIYGTDERIIFSSDRPRNGDRALYPQRDEYEEAPVVSGLWSLNPTTGDLFLVQHSPSGSFSPQIDSFGRLVYVRWDHLQRDQQADGDAMHNAGYGTFNYSDESAGAARLSDRTEIFPEPRGDRTDLLAATNLEGHTFNDFFPWMVNEDGTGEETLNHLGRHEFHSYFNRSLNDDPNLTYHSSATPRTNPNSIDNFLQIKEDPITAGTYYGIDAPEFSTHASGQVVRFNAPPDFNPDATVITYVTHRETHSYTDTPGPNHSGLYRNPLPLSNGTVITVHTPETRNDANTGTRQSPMSRYALRLKTLVASGSVSVAGQTLTPGISKSVSWWDPDVLVSYSGLLWELDPVEVRARAKPVRAATPMPPSVQQVFSQQNVAVAVMRNYLLQKGLAMIVGNNVTTRDRSDRQQPFNLRVSGGGTQTIGAGGKIYDVSHLQLFQADQIRGLGGVASPAAGRRVLAQFMHDPAAANPPLTGAPQASVAVAPDGSIAAFVPARRAMSWQLTAPGGTPVVRERYWVTMQPGEIRVCTSCHGINTRDQANQLAPANQPEALRQLLIFWKANGGIPPSRPTGVRINRTF